MRGKECFYKVQKTTHVDGNWWTIKCKDIDSMQDLFFDLGMLGMFEALDAAATVPKDPKDILFMDFDDKGKWKILTKDQLIKALEQ